jgi:hypothetical protein
MLIVLSSFDSVPLSGDVGANVDARAEDLLLMLATAVTLPCLLLHLGDRGKARLAVDSGASLSRDSEG